MIKYVSTIFAIMISIATASCIAAVADDFDFNHQGPIELLHYLKTNRNQVNTFVVREPVRDWVIEADIPKLVELLDSNEPCMGVMSGASSYVPGLSTVGDEAALLITGFQMRYYPPKLNSISFTPQQKQALRQWWRVYQSARNVDRHQNQEESKTPTILGKP